ncbi:MAG TPA: MHYT domain-containing protein [Gemmatimonadaceae bacterium]|nr:MHYT domain-containing protein [Gemmatimonadaceae bacterium]
MHFNTQSGAMASHFDVWLVGLSVVTAVLASYAALDLAGRVTAARGRSRAAWLVGGAGAMGLGIWSMHYVGMLAFHLGVPVYYDVPQVALSLIAAVMSSLVALWVSSRHEMGASRAIPASVVMGFGIAAMHYTGMAAMRLPATLSYSWPIVGLSVLIAIGVAFVAMWLAFHLREVSAFGWSKVSSSVLMGAAIPAMHYVGMAAARFTPTDTSLPFVRPPNAMDISGLGVTAVVTWTFMVLMIAIVTSRFDSQLSARSAALASSEGARRAQEAFLREVIDANPHFVFAKDWDGRFTLANRAVAAVYGTTPDQLVGKSDADFNPNPDEVDHFLRDDRAVIETGEPRFIAEEPVTNPETGATRWFQTIKVRLHAVDGTRDQVLGVATDITQRKTLEDQLRQAQKMEAVGRLAGGVAHDFNNLLTAILGNVELLAARASAAGDDEAVHDLKEVHAAAERAAGLTRQLLAFSRKQVLQPKRIDVSALVANMQRLLSRLIGEDIELRVVTGGADGTIAADPGQLEQVIMNLAVNARDAMPQGGQLTITSAVVDRSAIPARERDRMPGAKYVMLSIADSGVGMNEETKAHLFEPFFTTKPDGKGTGLGLATVYGIVKQSGGYIWVDSTPGRGAVFRLYFPHVAAPSAEGDGTTVAREPSWRGAGTILVVEDDVAVQRLTCRVLSARGYNVIAASDGDEAVKVARGYQGVIDLMLTDVVMPRMSGREVAERVGQQRPGMKVLFVSGYTDDAVVRHGIEEDKVSFLHKPFTPEILERRVREVLSAT